MTDTLGQWASAPLVYVLAEIRCSPTLDVQRRAAAVQDRIRAEYPLLEPAVEVSVSPGLPGGGATGAIFAFTDPTKKRGVLITSSSVCFHATEYETSTEFLGQLGSVLELLQPVYAADTVTRLGLRYVDVILPRQSELVFDYVHPGIGGVSLDGGAERRVQCVVEQPRANGGLAVRFLALGIPLWRSPDLPALGLRQPAWVEEAAERRRATAILDTDSWVTTERQFSADDLLGTFRELKTGITAAFLSAITPHAKKVWKAPRRND